ncbi:MAG: hypothetical protein M3P34_09745 [Actinomycetota bacterium]|nr:hypothetical protein [Actinomycetota bacterium]
MNLHLMEGLRSAVGLKAGGFEPRLEPEVGLCCVRFGCAACARAAGPVWVGTEPLHPS